MIRSGLVKSACVAVALFSVCPPPANAVVAYRGPAGGVRAHGAYGGGVYRGPHGGVYAHGPAGGVYRGGAYGYHGGVYRGYGGWARPGWYHWAPGGAIAAGAALGVLATGAAIAYAGQPPAPGMCWYYTDPSYRQGFWDAC
jgi:hypothetical protein